MCRGFRTVASPVLLAVLGLAPGLAVADSGGAADLAGQVAGPGRAREEGLRQLRAERQARREWEAARIRVRGESLRLQWEDLRVWRDAGAEACDRGPGR